MITAEQLAQEMKLYMGEVIPQGPGLGWLAKCPTCPDGASLSMAFNQVGPDLLVKCYGGCQDEELLRALGAVRGFAGLTAYQWIKQEIQRGGSPHQAHETVSRLLVHPPTPRYHHTTDLGNAERFVSLHGERIRFSRSLGWMVWTGKRWAQDTTGEVSRLAVEAVRNIYREAAEADDEKERKALAKHAMHSEAKNHIKAAIELASFAQGVACRGDEFDQKPWLFNCLNGTLDLRTGELFPHQPSDLLIQLSPVSYDPRATCITWQRYLLEVMQGKEELVSFLQRAVGYTLTGKTGEQKFFLCWGEGRNGKGVFMNALLYLMGDYAKVSQFSTFEEGHERANTPRGDLVALRGKRLVFASENREKMPLAESLIKGVTGNDPITARQLHREEITFTPAFKLWLACNHKPIIKGTDEAIWERVLFLPWLRYFKPDERDHDLADKLKQEASGILNWAIQGCLAWQKDGLNPPQEVRAAVKEYREEMDSLAGFLAACCETTGQITSSELYDAYLLYCREEAGEAPQPQKRFSERLSKLGFDKAKTKKANIWKGITLKPMGERGSKHLDPYPGTN